MTKTYYLAPAKLNLFLHITSQRKDGYHNLQTVFQFIDYNDIISFSIRNDGQLSCQSNAKNLPPEQDLVLRAARLLKQYSGTKLGADIEVDKKIPIGGGLGGGSSDAATTLLALNQLWQLKISSEHLAVMGLSLGADVPIFVYGQSAWAEGIGDLLSPIKLDEPWYLVIHPGCHVSTAKIFSAKDLTRDTLPIKIADFLAGRTQNVFENIVCNQYPQIGQAIDWLSQYSKARLTGTGACIFARFENCAEAKIVLAKLPQKWFGFVAQGKNFSTSKKSYLQKPK
jgi:4-diphosphocytidyl-2-C-methyl-D-erythritol kinase